MELRSKFLGKEYDGFKVVNYFVKNDYKKVYKNAKQKNHRAYNYELYNETTKQHLTISGNQLRLIDSGKTTINKMLHENKKGGKNLKINAYRKWLKENR
jgi:hypothetical protein